MPRATGRVKFFVEGKPDEFVKGTGYGFIAIDGSAQEVFVHRMQLRESCLQTPKHGVKRQTLFPDQHVSFELVNTDRGYKAEDVDLIG